jgi:RecJ-like exonuclease
MKCRGSGYVNILQMSCSACQGIGFIEYHEKCKNCKGSGLVNICKDSCGFCNGKGYRDWIDEIRRPI